MQLRLFGGLAVTVDGRPVALGSPKQRLVLAALAVEANRVVPVDRLIDVVWGEQVPNDPAASLQAYVSNLRRLLEPERSDGRPEVLVTQAPGYRLVVAADDLDVARAERLVADGLAAQRAGEHAAAAAHFEAALAMSAEPPVPELAGRPLGVALHARWVAQRGAAIEGLVDAQLALGQHALVAATAARWIEEHPHREHLRAQHALALYRAGRQVEALRSIDETRRLLLEDVGVSLSPELQTLEARILDHDSGLDHQATRTAPARAPSVANPVDVTVPAPARRPDAPLFGRAKELDALLAALTAAQQGRGSSVVVTGEPGIGKTRLVQELVDVAAARGFVVGWGRCPESGAAPSFWAANQITDQLLRAGVLDPEKFGLLPQTVPDDLPTAGAKRFALQVTVTDALRTATAPLLLVIDDVQWADAATLALLEFVAAELHDVAALVVVTARPTGPESPRALVECLGELARQRDTLQLRLDGLDVATTAAWVNARAGAVVPARVIELVHDRSGGNPFYFGELVALLDSEGRLHDFRIDRSTSGWVPAAVQDVIRRRVSRLPGDVQRVLSLASVIGRTFDADVLSMVADVDALDLLDLLDTACRSGMVGAADAPGRFAFSHALVAEALSAELSAARLAASHAAVVSAIEARRAADLEPHLAELAHHAFAAIAAGLAQKAHDYSVRAAQLASASVAHEDAAVHWTRALRALDALGVGDDPARYDALVGLGSTQLILDDLTNAPGNLLAAANVATRRGDHVAAARAVAPLNHASLWEPNNYRNRNVAVADTLERVLAELPPGHDELRALVLGALSIELHHVDRVRRVQLADEAVQLARRVGNPATLVRSLSNRNFAHHVAEGHAVRTEVNLELRELVARDDVPDELKALSWFIIANNDREAGDTDGVREMLAAAADAAERSGALSLYAQVRFAQATVEISLGNFDLSDALATSANELYRRGRGFAADVLYAAVTLQSTLERFGAGVVADAMAHGSGDVFEDQWNRVLAWVQVEAGDLEAARRTYALAEANGPSARDWTWLMVTVVTGLVQVALDDRDGAARTYAALEPYAGRFALAGTTGPVFDAVDSCLGVLAAHLGKHDAARAHFTAAIDLNDRAGARVWLARSLQMQGEWLLGRGEVAEAERSFARALALAEQLGSVQIAALVARARAAAAVR